MSKYCQNCGKEINENAVVCIHCGSAITPLKKKVEGKGLGIASMIIGIVAVYNAFMYTLLGLALISEEELFFQDRILFNMIFNFWPVAMGVTGLALGIAGMSKNKLGFTFAGIILNSIALFLCILSFITCMVV